MTETMNLFAAKGVDVFLTAQHIHLQGAKSALEMAEACFGYWKWDEKSDPALPVRKARIWRTWQNLERLSRVFPGQLRFEQANDHPIRVAMREDYAAYKARVQLGLRVKRGEVGVDHSLKFPPWAHQRMLLSFIVMMQHAVISADCGAGKTYIALSLIDWFKKQHGAVKALVLCPISIIDEAWGEDTEKLTDLSWTSLWVPQPYVLKNEKEAGLTQKRKRRNQQLEQLGRNDVDLWVANFETVREPEMLKALVRKRFDLVVIDESSRIKNPNSKSYKAAKKVSAKAHHRVAMTGTLSAKDCLDAWTAFDFVDSGETLDAYYTDFRAEFANPVRVGEDQVTWRPKTGAAERLAPIISRRSARVALDDCIDLPEVTTIVRKVPMTAMQAKAHQTMKEELFAELEGRSLDVHNQLAKLAKLRQITGGFVNIDGEWTPLKTNPKLDELRGFLDEVGPDHKVIVWSEFREEIKAILAAFPERNPVARYGAVSKTKQTENYRRFKYDPSCSMLVSHPLSSGHGITAVEATYSISFSIDFDFDKDYQKNRRIRRPGQKKAHFFVYLLATDTRPKPIRSVDEDMYACLRHKRRMSDILTPGRFNRAAYEAAVEAVSKHSR